MKNSLEDKRKKINLIDDQIVKLITKRLEVVNEVAYIKKQSDLPIDNKMRENEVIQRLNENLQPKYTKYVDEIYNQIFTTCKSYQNDILKCREFLLGEKLPYSYSPDIHALLGSKLYELKQIDSENLQQFFLQKKFDFINVSIPYKKQAIKYLDQLDDISLKTQAVNTVVNKNGKLYGYNTDYQALEFTLKSENITVKDKVVAILGSGGAGSMAKILCQNYGAREILVVSRCSDINYSTIYNYPVQVIINATPVGTYPNCDSQLLDFSQFKNLQSFVDLTYNPLYTNSYQNAKKLGCKCVNGLKMLVYQAIKSREIAYDLRYDESVFNNVYASIFKRCCNVVLIGMPGCGKSRIAKLLAEKLNKQVVDSDKQFEKKYGSTTNFIMQYGEQEFRQKESEIICEISQNKGCVIATGGGVVLSSQNMKLLKYNGVIIYVKRNLEKLSKKNRPLSKDYESLKKLFSVRSKLYEEYSDYCVENNGLIEDTAQKVINIYENSCN